MLPINAITVTIRSGKVKKGIVKTMGNLSQGLLKLLIAKVVLSVRQGIQVRRGSGSLSSPEDYKLSFVSLRMTAKVPELGCFQWLSQHPSHLR